MALTSKQKTRVIYYLGWSGLTIVPDSTQFNSVVNDRLNDASDNVDISNLVKELLEKLEHIDECLEKAKCRLAASSVDNIQMRDDEIMQLLKERKRYIRELSDLLDIKMVKTGGAMVGVRV